MWDAIRTILLFYILPVAVPFVVAFGIYWIAKPLAGWLVPIGQLTRSRRRTAEQRDARRRTLISLIAGMISFVAFFVALLTAIAAFVGRDSLIWMIGLFGAGFGFAAKPFIGDYMTGILFIIEDEFDIGEKVEIFDVEGVVEEITLRTVTLRGMDGEEYIIPNGEIRRVRNFSRGRYTPVKVQIQVPSSQLRSTVDFLEALGQEAVTELPGLLEPWKVIAENGTVGAHTELTIAAKAEFKQGAHLKPRLLALVEERLTAKDIKLQS